MRCSADDHGWAFFVWPGEKLSVPGDTPRAIVRSETRPSFLSSGVRYGRRPSLGIEAVALSSSRFIGKSPSVLVGVRCLGDIVHSRPVFVHSAGPAARPDVEGR